MKKIFSGVLMTLSLCAGVALATTIEGYTPTGTFQSVFVSDDGRLFVETSSGVAQAVTVVGGTVAVQNTQGGSLTVNATIDGEPIEVNCISGCSGGGGVPVASMTVTVSAQGSSVGGGVSFELIAANANRKSFSIRNTSDLTGMVTVLYIGPVGVDENDGMPLFPGESYDPAGPHATFTGALSGNSTGSVTWATIYHE